MGEGGGEKENFQSLVHSPDGHQGLGYARQKSGASFRSPKWEAE